MLQFDLVEVEKSKKLIFHRINPFLAISKLRLSAYLGTPSGIPKLKFWLGLLIPKLFSYPLCFLKCVNFSEFVGGHTLGFFKYRTEIACVMKADL